MTDRVTESDGQWETAQRGIRTGRDTCTVEGRRDRVREGNRRDRERGRKGGERYVQMGPGRERTTEGER